MLAATSFNFTNYQSNDPADVLIKGHLNLSTSGQLPIDEIDQNNWVFRVAAENEYGQGDFSEPSKPLNEAEPLALLTETAEMAIVIAIGCVGVFMLMLAVYGCFLGESSSSLSRNVNSMMNSKAVSSSSRYKKEQIKCVKFSYLVLLHCQ